jgi:hypothetical protein
MLCCVRHIGATSGEQRSAPAGRPIPRGSSRGCRGVSPADSGRKAGPLQVRRPVESGLAIGLAQDTEPARMMVPLKVRRSAMARRAGVSKAFAQPSKDSLEAMARLFFSQRSARNWRSGSTHLRSSAMQPSPLTRRVRRGSRRRSSWPAAPGSRAWGSVRSTPRVRRSRRRVQITVWLMASQSSSKACSRWFGTPCHLRLP